MTLLQLKLYKLTCRSSFFEMCTPAMTPTVATIDTPNATLAPDDISKLKRLIKVGFCRAKIVDFRETRHVWIRNSP